MSMSKTANKDELEYRFTDEQMNDEVMASDAQATVIPENSEKEAKKGKSSFISRKKLTYGLVGIMVIGGLFQFMSNRDKSANEGSQAEVEQAAKERNMQKQAAVSQPVASKPAVAAPSTKAVETDNEAA